jgi:hypothetical protein
MAKAVTRRRGMAAVAGSARSRASASSAVHARQLDVHEDQVRLLRAGAARSPSSPLRASTVA